MKFFSVMKKAVAAGTILAATAGVTAYLIKTGKIEIPGRKDEDEDLDDEYFDEDLTDLFDDFQDDAEVINIRTEEETEEEASAEEAAEAEAPAEEAAEAEAPAEEAAEAEAPAEEAAEAEAPAEEAAEAEAPAEEE